MIINDSLINYILNSDDETLAKIYAGFIKHEWPGILPDDYKPDWWKGTSYIHGESLNGRRYGFCLPFLDYINSKLPKEFLHQYMFID